MSSWLKVESKREACSLCEKPINNMGDLSRSHIFPKKFWDRPFKIAEVLKNQSVKKHQTPPLDHNLLCHDCEKTYFKIDGLAIAFLRDRRKSVKIAERVIDGNNMSLTVFPDNRKLFKNLRNFAATILWRAHKTPIIDFSLSIKDEEKIKKGILEEGSLDFIDVLVYRLNNDLHKNIVMPQLRVFDNVMPSRDTKNSVGCDFYLPNLKMSISFGKHPHRSYMDFQGFDNFTGKATTSLSMAEDEGYDFCTLQLDSLNGIDSSYQTILSKKGLIDEGYQLIIR